VLAHGDVVEVVVVVHLRRGEPQVVLQRVGERDAVAYELSDHQLAYIPTSEAPLSESPPAAG
jgi:hypothetical protein